MLRYTLDSTWGSESSGAPPLVDPVAFASHPGGGLVVADQNQELYISWLQRWNAAGRYLTLLPPRGLWDKGGVSAGVNWVNTLTNVGVDSTGSVYVLDSGSFVAPKRSILKLDANGNFLLSWNLRDKGVTSGAICVSRNRVYVLAQNSVEVYNTTGGYLATIGQGRLRTQPRDMAVDGATGRIFVVELARGDDHAIQVFNATSGAFLFSWRNNIPLSVAADPSESGGGDIFVATLEPFKLGEFNITRYSRTRAPLTTFKYTTPGANAWTVNNIHVDVDWSGGGHVYVLDLGLRAVRRLNPVRRVPAPRPPPLRRPSDPLPTRLAKLPASCTTKDRWCTLQGTALAPDGSLFIAGGSEQAVVRLAPTGSTYRPALDPSVTTTMLNNIKGVGVDAANNSYAVVSSECNYYATGGGCSEGSEGDDGPISYKILKFGPAGVLVKEWSVVDLGFGGGAVALGTDRLYLVAKDSIAAYTLEGAFVGSLAGAYLTWPVDVAVGPGGDLLVIDDDSFFRGVKVFSPAGVLKAAWPVTDAGLLAVDTLAVDPSSGDVWVGSRLNAPCKTVANSPNGCWKVTKFSPDGVARLAFEYGTKFTRDIICPAACFDLVVDGRRSVLWVTDWDGQVSRYRIRAAAG